MEPDSVKIRFYFPDAKQAPKDKSGFVDAILGEMRNDGGISYAGYAKEEEFKSDFTNNIGNGSPENYTNVTDKQKKEIEETILETLTDLHGSLPHPDLPVFVFVYPWLPTVEDNEHFKGTMGSAVYYSLHLFIDANSYTKESLRAMLAHEWSHLVYYRFQNPTLTLLDYLITEGEAETFREEVMGGEPAPWSVTLTREEAQKQFDELRPQFNSTDRQLYRRVFFGDTKFKRWSGYSIGYWLIQKVKEKHPNLSWNELIRLRPREVLEKI